MAIKFERDKNGALVAVDENGKKIGAVATMGDLIAKNPSGESQNDKEKG